MRKTKAQKRHGKRWEALRKAYKATRDSERLSHRTPSEMRRFGYPAPVPAKLALHYVKQASKRADALDWRSDRAEEKRDGFTLVYTIGHDDCPDTDFLGKLSDKWEPGAIDRFRAEAANSGTCGDSASTEEIEEEAARRARYSREYRYFIPSDMRGTYEETRAYYRARGYPRHVAHELAKRMPAEDRKRLESLGNDWHYVTITAEASRNGIELGSASLGGIESDSEPAYIDETCRELASEAIAEARSALAKLRRR